MLGVQRLGPIRKVAEPGRPGELHAVEEPGVQPGNAALAAERATTACAPVACAPAESARGISALAAESAPAASAPSSAAAPSQTAYALTERDAWIVLVSVQGLGPVTFGSLLSAFGSGRAVVAAASGECGLESLREGMDAARAHSGDEDPNHADLPIAVARRLVEAVQSAPLTLAHLISLGIEGVTLEDEEYPRRLRLVDMPPPLLFVRGNRQSLDGPDMVAVVGTRRPTDKGRLIAGWIGAALANAGACVVSGMAVGIDGAAHAATLGEGGRTVAVLGGGHEHLFPRSHERLADAIVASGGAVLSEYSPGTAPSRGTFPRRNRLVSGMSDATVVVEAGRRSGALITAGWALEQGRECYLVPGPLGSPASAGCLDFLRSFPGQARVVCGIPELIEDLGLAGGPASPSNEGSPPLSRLQPAGRAAVLATLSDLERALAERLATGPASADELAIATASSPAAVLSALTLLELRGLVSAGYGRYLPAGSLLTAGSVSARRP